MCGSVYKPYYLSTHVDTHSSRSCHTHTHSEAVAFLDILAPPYNPNEGRDCTYYTRKTVISPLLTSLCHLVDPQYPWSQAIPDFILLLSTAKIKKNPGDVYSCKINSRIGLFALFSPDLTCTMDCFINIFPCLIYLFLLFTD